MRTDHREFYVRHDFSFYDCGLLAVLPLPLFAVYDILRRFVWRSDTYGDAFTQELCQQGYIVANVHQNTIAEMLGYTRRATVCEYVALLKELGWVIAHTDPNRGETRYLLGEVIQGPNGGRLEAFYADGSLRDITATILREAMEETDNPSLHDVPLPRRVEITRAYVESLKGAVRSGVRSEYAPADTPRTPGRNPISKSASHSTNPEETKQRPRWNNGGPPAPRTPRDRKSEFDPSREVSTQEGFSDSPELREGESQEGEFENESSQSSRTPPIPRVPPANPVSPQAQVQSALERKRQEFLAAQKQLASQQIREEGISTRRAETLKHGKARSTVDRGALSSLEALWRERMGALRPGVVLAPWGPAEKTVMERLYKDYGSDVARRMIEYITGNWDDINARIWKGKGTQPTVSMIGRLHETLAAEVQAKAKTSGVEAEVEAWYAAHPGQSLPAELAERYASSK